MLRSLLLALIVLGVHAEETCLPGFSVDCECDGFFSLDCHCPSGYESTGYGGCVHADQDVTLILLLPCILDENCEVTSFLGGHCEVGHKVDMGLLFNTCASDTHPPPPSPSPPPPVGAVGSSP